MTGTQAPPKPYAKKWKKRRPMPLRRLERDVQESAMAKRFRANNWFISNQHTIDTLMRILRSHA